MLVRRKSIVTQTVRRLEKATGCKIGTMMGRHTNDIMNPCCVASIDTVSRRLNSTDVQNWIRHFDLIIVDEAHDATSDSYQSVLGFIITHKCVSVIGYTATPYRIGRKGHTWWDCCVKPVTAAELRDAGYLAPITIYSPANINTQNISIQRGDFVNKELYATVNQRKIYGKIVKTYERLAKGKSALVFCVNKEHSRRVCEAFTANGYVSMHCDCGTDVEERKRVLSYLGDSRRSGKPFILCNVNIFSTGIDVPSVEVVIQARPTASKVLYIQQVGRALRTFNGKYKALLIDHGGNALRFGSPYDDHDPELVDLDRIPRQASAPPVGHRCQACGYYSSTLHDVCPGCGHTRAKDMIIPKEVDDPLHLFQCDNLAKLKKELHFIKEALYNKNKSADFAYYVLHKKHGASIIEYLPELNCPDIIRRAIEKRQLGRDRAEAKARAQVKTQLYN